MGDLYASVVGTIVLQIKEIPLRPLENNGQLCLWGLADSVDEAQIRAALKDHGTITDCQRQLGGWPPALVTFSTHDASKRLAADLPPALCTGVSLFYNELPYDERGWVKLDRGSHTLASLCLPCSPLLILPLHHPPCTAAYAAAKTFTTCTEQLALYT